MKCTNCGAEVQLRSEHCHVCGQRVVVDFDVLAQSVQDDAAVRRSEQIAGALRWVILGLLIVGALIYSINDLFDKPLVYDGAGLPAIPAPGNIQVELPTLYKPYAEPRPNPNLPPPRMTAFGYRSSPIKERLREASKGHIPPDPKSSKKVVDAVKSGLDFIAQHQDFEGWWTAAWFPRDWDQFKCREYQWGNVGITSLALLAFLGDGETWLKDTSNRASPYAEKIRKGLRWLASKQDAEGRFGYGDAESVHYMYNHCLATLAFCEAAGISGDEQLRDIAQKGLDFLVKTQTPAGGWNYRADPAGDTDTSLSAWGVQAFLAAREARMKVTDETLKKCNELYQKATLADGRVIYSMNSGDDKTDHPALSGAALMLRQLLGEDPKTPALRTIAARMHDLVPQTRPQWSNWRPNPKNDDEARAGYDPYKMYFCTYGMYFVGGKDWETWHDAMKKTALEMQERDGAWRTNDPWSMCAGNIYATALMVMTLQVYYRIQ